MNRSRTMPGGTHHATAGMSGAPRVRPRGRPHRSRDGRTAPARRGSGHAGQGPRTPFTGISGMERRGIPRGSGAPLARREPGAEGGVPGGTGGPARTRRGRLGEPDAFIPERSTAGDPTPHQACPFAFRYQRGKGRTCAERHHLVSASVFLTPLDPSEDRARLAVQLPIQASTLRNDPKWLHSGTPSLPDRSHAVRRPAARPRRSATREKRPLTCPEPRTTRALRAEPPHHAPSRATPPGGHPTSAPGTGRGRTARPPAPGRPPGTGSAAPPGRREERSARKSPPHNVDRFSHHSPGPAMRISPVSANDRQIIGKGGQRHGCGTHSAAREPEGALSAGDAGPPRFPATCRAAPGDARPTRARAGRCTRRSRRPPRPPGTTASAWSPVPR